jgi:hypothetical protein
MLQTGVLPPPMVVQFTLELIKMMVHPIRNSRGVVDLIDSFQDMLMAQMMTNTVPMIPPPPGMGAPPSTPPPPQQGNGAMPPPPPGPMQ